jgi:hypothetical protein
MDRRRRFQFAPRIDGLETRQLLSTATATTAQVSSAKTTTTTTTATTDTNTTALRKLRIDRLPNYMMQIRAGRGLPLATVAKLQNDLRAIENQLVAAPSSSLRAFNLQLRSSLGSPSVSVATAKALNDTFEKLLLRMGANPSVADTFASHMDELTQFNTQGPLATQTTVNDYSLIAQLVQGIGIKTINNTAK